MSDYSQLAGTSFMSTPPKDPKDELFHSCYISGVKRTNEVGIVERPGYLQIRGNQYNLEEVYMIITHVKQVLVKMSKINGKDHLECFSYQEGQIPFKGTSGNVCGKNSNERACNAFCSTCKAQIIVSGILCSSSGSPILKEDGKPNFIFIRGKGMKYSNVSDYLNRCSQLNFPYLFPENPNDMLEKGVFNRSRILTKITVGSVESRYGDKDVFEFLEPEKSVKLPDELVKKQILKIATDMLEKFNDKMDWSKNSNNNNNQNTNYMQNNTQTQPPQDEQMFNFNSSNNKEPQKQNQPEITPNVNFNFDDIAF